MDKKCHGCGYPLQTNNKTLGGYTQKMDNDYCESCFRLRHYGDLSKVNVFKVDPYETLQKISQLDALYVWVIDLFHLEESQINSLHRWLRDEPVVLMVTKRELLPQTMSVTKIKEALMPFIKDSYLNIVDVLVTGKFGKINKEYNIERLNQLKQETNKEKVVFFGNTNVGKSSVINELSNQKQLSVSALPGTTLDLVLVDSEIENLYDSAGIAIQEGLLEKLSAKKVKSLSQKKIKPLTLQLKGDQSLIIDGFGYFNFSYADKYSITCYLPDSLKLHRTKTSQVIEQFDRMSEKFDELQTDSMIIKKVYLNHPTTDILIYHLGFITVHNSQVKIESHFKESVMINTRKALL